MAELLTLRALDQLSLCTIDSPRVALTFTAYALDRLGGEAFFVVEVAGFQLAFV